MESIKIILVLLVASISYNLTFAQTTTDSLSISHEEITKQINFKPKIPIKTIGIFVYDGFNTLDGMCPYHILSQIMGAEVFFIAKKKGMVKNQSGLQIKVDKSISNIKKLDILVIPGGAAETYEMTKDTTVLNWIKLIDKTTNYTTSVCTGAWILGATGLLKGKNATTNWYRAEEMLKVYGANFKQERYVKDGKYWTSAGVTAGMDMSLAIIDDLFGKNYTQAVMLDLEYDPKPPYNAGTPKKTEPVVNKMMTEMYDKIFQPLMMNKEQKK
jgi:transcriptional regulator GlxA family with amidase domain